MSEKKNKTVTRRPYRFLGRMSNEEYEAMWHNDKKLSPERAKDIRRLTDEEYEELRTNKYLLKTIKTKEQ